MYTHIYLHRHINTYICGYTHVRAQSTHTSGVHVSARTADCGPPSSIVNCTVNNRHAACAKALLERHPALLAFNGRAPAPATLLDTAAEVLLQDPAVSDTAPAVQLSERCVCDGHRKLAWSSFPAFFIFDLSFF